jgi:hypothetical protein
MKNKKMFIVLGVLVVVLVATAAFVGGRFLNQQGANPIGNAIQSIGGRSGSSEISSGLLDFIPAPEMPTTEPVVTGSFAERKDNTIFVYQISMEMASGGSSVSVSVSADTGPASSNDNQGPKVEVVINNKTKIYKDVTQMDFKPGDGTKKIQQVLEPGSLDDLTTNVMITIWGRKVGDRVIADVIVYSEPFSVVK